MKNGKALIRTRQMIAIINHKTQVFFMYFLYDELVAVKDNWRLPFKGEIPSATNRAM